MGTPDTNYVESESRGVPCAACGRLRPGRPPIHGPNPLPLPVGRPPGPDESLFDRNATIVADYLHGDSLERVGRRYGITRERVRQIVTAAQPDEGIRKQGRRAVRDARRAQHEADHLARINAATEFRLCFVCWCVFRTDDERKLHARVPTCSPICRDLYFRTRHLIDREAWLRQFAKSALKRDVYGARGWAERTLAGIRPSRESYTKPRTDSKCGVAFAEVCRLRVENSLTELPTTSPAANPDPVASLPTAYSSDSDAHGGHTTQEAK